jgi:excisionase family DNA binding protein
MPDSADQPASSLDEPMTAQQLADLLLVHKSTVEDYARRGLLPSLKLGRHRRFIRSDVIDALDSLRGHRP